MRTKYILTLIGAACIAASASAEPNVSISSPAANLVPVIGKTGPALKASEYGRLQGLYQLDDGRVLEVTFEKRKLYADLGGAKTEIFPAGINRFVSGDDTLRVEFDSTGRPLDVTVSETTGQRNTKG